MRDPIHRVQPYEPRPIPRAPGNLFLFGATRGRLHERPTAQDDEHAHGMETKARYFEPDQSEDRQRDRRDVAPIRRRKHAMLEVSREKVKIDDEQDGEAL